MNGKTTRLRDDPAAREELLGRHPPAPVIGERVGGEARPQHHPVGQRVTGGYAEAERVGGEARLRPYPAGAGPGAEDQGRSPRPAQPDERPAVYLTHT